MSDFDFPAQPEPAELMPFETLTGNSHASNLTHVAKASSMNSEGKENAGTASSNSATLRNFIAKPSPCTPAHAAMPIRVVHPGPKSDDLPSMAELLAWKNPPASFCAMLFGAGALCTASFAFSSKAPFLSGASSLLGCMLALNFVRSTFSATWLKHCAWSGSEFETLLMSRSKDFIAFLMLARDQLMCSENPWVMLGTCVALALLRNIAFYTNFWTLMAISWTMCFLLAPSWRRVGAMYARVHAKSMAIGKALAAKLRLDRLSKACCIAITGLAAAFISDTASKGFLVLSFLMFVRCSMKNKEVKAVQQSKIVQSVASSHLVRSAFHATERAGTFADDVLMSAMKSARKQLGANSH